MTYRDRLLSSTGMAGVFAMYGAVVMWMMALQRRISRGVNHDPAP